MKTFDTVAVFLNRACPRNCPQCGISDNSRPSLSIDEWKQAFLILKDQFKTRFFLILGTEPLMLRGDLVELIEWFHKNELFYGFYSTSPKILFDKYKHELIAAKLNNWSCGIDSAPGIPDEDPITRKKSEEGYAGLQWMANRGVQTFSVTTVTNKNLSYVAGILEDIQENIPNVISCINPVEWAHDGSFDFFSEKEYMSDLVIPPSRYLDTVKMVEDVLLLTRRKGYQIQNTDRYLLDFPKYYDTLDYVCEGQVGMGIDCDGMFRLCGYNQGNHVRQYSIWDLPQNRDKIIASWSADAISCKGCHWSYIYALQETFESLIPNSRYFTERWKVPIPNVRQHLKTHWQDEE